MTKEETKKTEIAIVCKARSVGATYDNYLRMHKMIATNGSDGANIRFIIPEYENCLSEIKKLVENIKPGYCDSYIYDSGNGKSYGIEEFRDLILNIIDKVWSEKDESKNI